MIERKRGWEGGREALQVKTDLRWELPLCLATARLSQNLLVLWDWELWEFRLGQTGFPKGAAEWLEPPTPSCGWL